MIDWHSLLNDAGVMWRDHGPNTSKNNLNVCCPFCGDDYGYHLAISLQGKGYFCYRSPGHKGVSARWLLKHLGIDAERAKQLIDAYSDGEITKEYNVKPKQHADHTTAWSRLSPIKHQLAHKYILYLQERGFPDAEAVALEYDLRFALVGVWALRVLMPLRRALHRGKVAAWTGRAIYNYLKPKYLSTPSLTADMLYTPKPIRDCAVIVEGPFDALKVSAACRNAGGIAITGKYISPGRIVELKNYLKAANKIVFVPDADVPLQERYSMCANLQQATRIPIKIINTPDEYKDPGEMPYYEIRHWLGVK